MLKVIFFLNFFLTISFLTPTSLYSNSCCPAPAGPPGINGLPGVTGPTGATGPQGIPSFGAIGPPADPAFSVDVNCGIDSYMLFARIAIPLTGSTSGMITTNNNLVTYTYVATPTSIILSGFEITGYIFTATAEGVNGLPIAVTLDNSGVNVMFNYGNPPSFVSFFGIKCGTF